MQPTAIIHIAALLFILAAGPGLTALWLQFRALVKRVGDLEALRLLDAAERGRLQQEMDELRRGIAVLIAQVRRAGLTPEWSPPPAPPPPAAEGQRAETDRLVALWLEIEERFSPEEMDDLAFELRLPESHAETPGARARDLVNNARRHGKLNGLIAIGERERPKGRWRS